MVFEEYAIKTPFDRQKKKKKKKFYRTKPPLTP